MQNWNQPRQRPSVVIGRITTRQPVSHAGARLAEKGKGWLGAVQSVGPATERGGFGHAIGIFERRRRLFPGTVLHKAPPQRLTARQQTVMRVRERKPRQEGEGLPATGAATATDANPIVVFIVRLLAAASVANDRIAFTSGAAPQDDFGAASGPIRFELVRRDGKWDKQNRSSSGLCPSGVDRQDRSRKRSSFLLKKKIPTGEEYTASRLPLFKVCDSQNWPVIIGNTEVFA